MDFESSEWMRKIYFLSWEERIWWLKNSRLALLNLKLKLHRPFLVFKWFIALRTSITKVRTSFPVNCLRIGIGRNRNLTEMAWFIHCGSTCNNVTSAKSEGKFDDEKFFLKVWIFRFFSFSELDANEMCILFTSFLLHIWYTFLREWVCYTHITYIPFSHSCKQQSIIILSLLFV